MYVRRKLRGFLLSWLWLAVYIYRGSSRSSREMIDWPDLPKSLDRVDISPENRIRRYFPARIFEPFYWQRWAATAGEVPRTPAESNRRRRRRIRDSIGDWWSTMICRSTWRTTSTYWTVTGASGRWSTRCSASSLGTTKPSTSGREANSDSHSNTYIHTYIHLRARVWLIFGKLCCAGT